MADVTPDRVRRTAQVPRSMDPSEIAILDRMPVFMGSFGYFPGMGSMMPRRWAPPPPAEVRCDYCRYRIPSDSIKCLNCGAPKP